MTRYPGRLTPLIAVLPLVLSVSCNDNKPQWHEDAAVPLFISLSGPPTAEIRTDSLRKVVAPAVNFIAVTVKDGNHSSVLLSHEAGTIATMSYEDIARVGDTLAILDRPGGQPLGLISTSAGGWLPRMEVGSVVVPGDTVGIVQGGDFWLAEGDVNPSEGRTIHVGDSAVIKLWQDSDMVVTGRVEWVRRPLERSTGRTAVGVEFRHNRDAEHRGVADLVTILPTGPGDSVFAAPQAAVVKLSGGLALFIQQGQERYEVRFVDIGPQIGTLVMLHDELKQRERIVTAGLEALVIAAEDSLKQRRLK